MKLYLRNPQNFNSEVLRFYKDNFRLGEEKDADIIVINDFEPIETDKIVACNSTGIEQIKAKEIISLRGEDLSGLTAVAELSICMAGYLMRIFKGEELKEKTLGIWGIKGRIGRQLKKYAENMGMKVIGWDKGDSRLNMPMHDCDIVSLNITADEENRNFCNKEFFEKMKEEAIFLNSARPWLVDNDALLGALNSGKLAGAWTDFEMPFKHKNIMTTDHAGGTTKESKKISELIIAKKLCEMQKNK